MSLSEPLCAALWELGVEGVTIDDDETRARPYAPDIPKTGLATIAGTFVHKHGIQAHVLRRLNPLLHEARVLQMAPQLEWAPVPDEDWNEVWKRQWKPMSVSNRVMVVPSWERAAFVPTAGSVALLMDPGMAFGTGTHESTQLCCQELERLLQGRLFRRLLDVGTGSGILALAASKLAAASGNALERVVGVDVDEDAVRVAAENAAKNGVVLEVSATPVATLEGIYDLIVANILLEPLCRMAPELARLLDEDGVVVLSGILESQRPQLERAFCAVGLRAVEHHTLGEWASVRCVPTRNLVK
jgi:ribosomal protein L11 methyltransferase